MRQIGRFAAALTAVLVVPGAASAQSAQQWSVQGSGIYQGLSGDQYEGLKGGPGFEAQLRFTPGALSFGGGVQFSRHDFDLEGEDLDFQLASEPRLNIVGAFFEPRFVLPVGSNVFAPYLSGRVAFIRQMGTIEAASSPSAPAFDIDVTANGWQLNVGGGLLFRLAPRANLDVGVTVGRAQFQPAKFKVSVGSDSETVEADEGGSGINTVFRVGLALGIF